MDAPYDSSRREDSDTSRDGQLGEYGECFICMEARPLVSLEPCMHRVCETCARRCCAATRMRCPMCRRLVLSASVADPDANVVLPVGNGKHAGLTVCNDARGVRVIAMQKGDLAENALLPGDVISRINGLTVIDHVTTIAIIDACTIENRSVRLWVETHRSRLAWVPCMKRSCGGLDWRERLRRTIARRSNA